MPQPIYLPPPRDPFESILPFAMRLYEMKQRKDIAEAELSQRKEERAATAKTHEETLRANMMQNFDPVDRQEAQDQNMPSAQAIGGLNWKRRGSGLPPGYFKAGDSLYRTLPNGMVEPVKQEKTPTTIDAAWLAKHPNATPEEMAKFKRSMEKPTEHETWGKPYKENGQVFQQSNRGQVRKITGDQAETIRKWNLAATAAGLDPEKVARGEITSKEAEAVIEKYAKANGLAEVLKLLGVGGEETQGGGGTTSLKFDAQGKPIK